ncbi:MAG: formate dehydrogenase subunit alpha [Gemmatales bacterium]|nr:MAG: formate dehydrogenase subunit alpha [Gemmatales bacterium]
MSKTLHLTIDDRPVRVSPGTTIWQAARDHGIDIPVLCHDPKMTPVGVCRMCVVDIGTRVLAAACVRECEDGMVVRTRSPRVEQQRRVLLEWLLADHPVPCEREKTTGDCELEFLARQFGIVKSSCDAVASRQNGAARIDSSSRVIAVDHQACILCDRCIRACDEIQCNEVIGRMGRGTFTRIAFDLNDPMGKSTCVSCGECAAACPTGALTHKPITLPLVPESQTQAIDSVCPYCGVGCALTYHVFNNTIIRAEGRDNPGSEGRLCVKGRYGWDYALHHQRLTKPLIRRPEFYPKGPLSRAVKETGPSKPGGIVDYDEVLPAFREASWDEALDLVAANLLRIKKEHGPGALAGFGSAKCSNEEAYLFQKLIRAALGTNNVDHCTRLCHASSVAALLECIGSGAVTDVFGHIRHAEVALITGSNTTANHPVAATFFKQAAKRGTKLIVVDPRRPAIADFATWYCRIKPGSDVAFYNAIMHVLIYEGLIDEEYIQNHTENFTELRAVVEKYAPEYVSPLCGIEAPTIREIARTIGRSKSMMIFWGMGISQHTHGTDNARCLIALCLLTGNIGRLGTGLHPLRGQNNVQGASDAGLIPMVYPDYQPVGSEAVRQKFEAAWKAPLDPKPGLTVVEIMAAALRGDIRGMLMMGENPFLSDPNVNKVRQALARLDFLAVQDIFLTETAEFADVILPASSFLEKTGTYTNTDRRVQIGRKVLDPPGDARLDWQILCDLSHRLGYPMHYDSPEEIFAEFADLTTNYRGLNYDNLGATGKVWPCPKPMTSDGTLVLFGEGFPTPTGKGKFVPCEVAPADELPDDDFPFILNTGRILEHWHTGTMTRRASILNDLKPGPFAEAHPDDLARLGIRSGEPVTVRSRRGSIRLPVLASDSVTRGSIFIPFHFREAAANVLTNDALDPFGKIPEFKFCAVKMER